VDTSEDEDEERESSIGDTQHDDDANISEFVRGFEALPPKGILPQKPKEPSQKFLECKFTIPKAGKTTRFSVNRQVRQSKHTNCKPQEPHQPI
jgi:hypothetical protein